MLLSDEIAGGRARGPQRMVQGVLTVAGAREISAGREQVSMDPWVEFRPSPAGRCGAPAGGRWGVPRLHCTIESSLQRRYIGRLPQSSWEDNGLGKLQQGWKAADMLSEAVSEGRSPGPGDKLAVILKHSELSQVSSLNTWMSPWVTSTKMG